MAWLRTPVAWAIESQFGTCPLAFPHLFQRNQFLSVPLHLHVFSMVS